MAEPTEDTPEEREAKAAEVAAEVAADFRTLQWEFRFYWAVTIILVLVTR